MSIDGFSRSLGPVLAYEGGKVDDPRDPGGRTNQGVIQRVYDAYRRGKGNPTRDVYLMSADERDAIYRRQFWDAVHGDELPGGVDFVVFDAGVNSGPVRSIKWLQAALGVEVDGQMGMLTLEALRKMQNHDVLVDKLVDNREAFLRSLKTFKTFGRGWLNRTARVRQLGKAWAAGTVVAAPPPVVRPVQPVEKPDAADVKAAPTKALGDAATGAGVGAAGLGGILQTLQEQLTPFSMAGGWIGKLVVVLIILGAMLTIGGLAYRWWASRKKAERAAVVS